MSPQLLWFRKIRTNLTSLFVISIFINIGMWFERFVIIVSSLSNDYIPWAWDQMNPTWADWGILLGSFGWFGMWFLLFAKTFPIVAIQEIKEMIPMPRRRGGEGTERTGRPAWPRSSTSMRRWTRSARSAPRGIATWWCTLRLPITRSRRRWSRR